jgi:hypothetical protein
MSIRTNEVNNGGIVTVSGGNMPVQTFTNAQTYISRATGTGNTPVTAVVVANSHPVEVGGDGGVWDTTSGVVVNRDKTNLDTINT